MSQVTKIQIPTTAVLLNDEDKEQFETLLTNIRFYNEQISRMNDALKEMRD